jgi:hypothetical protein
LEATVELARAFAAAEPTTIIGYLDGQEEEGRLRGNERGERWWHSRLRAKLPASWLHGLTGLEQQGEMLRKETVRQPPLVTRIAFDLEHAGAQSKASGLLRALEGPSPAKPRPRCVAPS